MVEDPRERDEDALVETIVRVLRAQMEKDHAPVFRTAERAALAEALSFSPAHARTEHRPLGSINRARMRIYRLLSDFRDERDRVARLNQS